MVARGRTRTRQGRGRELHLPSASPYRKRWGDWEAALLHFGYTPEQVAERLGASTKPTKPREEPYAPLVLKLSGAQHPI